MNALLETALQAFGARKVSPTALDLKLLTGTDYLGRTNPTNSATFVGTAGISWRGGDPATDGYSNHGTAYSIISYILATAGPIPWNAYQVDSKDNRAEVVASHPLGELLYRPNPQQSWADFKMQCEGAYLVRGECFIRRVRPGVRSDDAQGRKRAGKTSELWCLVGKIDLLPMTGLGEFDTPTGYRHTDALTNVVREYAYDEVLHLKTWNPGDPHRGLSPILAGSDAITAAKSGLESRVRQYQNQGPPGIIYDDSDPEHNQPLSPAQVGGIQRFFDSFRAGRRREGNIPVVGGKLGYLRLGLTQVEMDVLAAIPYDKDAVADLFHFPGQLLNGSKGTTFNNMGEAGAALYSRCVLPLETVLRDGLNRWLGPEYADGVYLDFDTSHIPELQEAKRKQSAWLDTAWYVSTQDKQRMMGVPVDPDLPKYFIPSTLLTLDEVMGKLDVGDTAPGRADAVN